MKTVTLPLLFNTSIMSVRPFRETLCNVQLSYAIVSHLVLIYSFQLYFSKFLCSFFMCFCKLMISNISTCRRFLSLWLQKFVYSYSLNFTPSKYRELQIAMSILRILCEAYWCSRHVDFTISFKYLSTCELQEQFYGYVEI